MSIYTQARQLGFSIMGKLEPAEGKDLRCQYYPDGRRKHLYRPLGHLDNRSG
jgi:hypothetical protein